MTISTEEKKRTRKPRRNFEKLVNELALYCKVMADVLDRHPLPNGAGIAEAYKDVLARLEPKP